MPKKPAKDLSKFIFPLYMNGLSGRMLKLPAPKNKNRDILFIYGHHSSLERWLGIAEYLNRYGSITIPDLPGFGGMEPFYKIGEKPSLDNMADYLAAFIKLRYRKRRFCLVGFSYGFIIVTRMLQRYPELANKVDILFSLAGFSHKNDFQWKKRTLFLFRWSASLFSHRLPATFIRLFVLRSPFIKFSYKIVEDRHSKLFDADEQERKRRVNFEVVLWQTNDFRTYADTAKSMFRVNLTGKHVDLPVYHIGVAEDRYFNNVRVEQHMRTIYKDFIFIPTSLRAHAPTVLATADEGAQFIPLKARRLLNKKV